MGICHTKSSSHDNPSKKQAHNQNPHYQGQSNQHQQHAQKPNKIEKPKKEIKPKKFLLYYPATLEESKHIESFGQIGVMNGILGRGIYLYDDFKEAKKIGKLKDKKTVVFQVEVKSFNSKTSGWEEGGEYGYDFGYDGRKNYCAYNTNIVTIKKKVDCFKIKHGNISGISVEDKQDDGY